MAIVDRQNNLFAAEDWKVAYQAYSKINFKAYDFNTMRSAMVDYVRINFPESFNDYIESSEFIAIIELLAYLSQSLAFRVDLNARENFLETAERRDSVFKLARMLGYNPRRNIPASGLVKIVSVRTSEDLVDSQGNDLQNQNVFWNDVNNSDNYEQFLTIINSAMGGKCRFTAPVNEGKIQGIPIEKYEINTTVNAPVAFGFGSTAGGKSRQFEVVNGDFFDNQYVYEEAPDPAKRFGFYYRNDSLGLNSENTGFFLYIKQGTLTFEDFNFVQPVESRIQDITTRNINEFDVYLQEINSQGIVLNQWTKIPNTVGQTLNYNSQNLGTRNLYAIENLNNAGIRLKFPDGNFGNIPSGVYRAWYRTSDNERYSIKPAEMQNKSVTIPYNNQAGETHRLTLTFSLESAINNSLPTETLANIKSRAPQTYYTQNRMISAQDYNVFPLSQSSNIRKLKATNKTHAGHSRYIDINDPTSTFQSVDTFAQDGFLIKEVNNISKNFVVDTNNSANDITNNVFPLYLKESSFNNFVYDEVRRTWRNFVPSKFETKSLNARWKPLPVATSSATGYMTETFSSGDGSTVVLANNTESTRVFSENNFIKFVNTSDISQYKWVRVVSVANNGLLSSGLSTSVGSFTLSDSINDGWRAEEVIVTPRKVFNSTEAARVQDEIIAKRTFGIGFDVTLDEFYVIQNENLNANGVYAVSNARDTSATSKDASWLILCEYIPVDNSSYSYNVTLRGLDYVVQSKNELKFYNIKNVKTVDYTTKAVQDKITFTTLNHKPGTVEEFVWEDSGTDGIADAWQGSQTGAYHDPIGVLTQIPLKTRDVKWYDIAVKWKSNFGLMRNDGITDDHTPANILVKNRFVNNANVTLTTYFDDGNVSTSNVRIANNDGRISKIPYNFSFDFDNTTFGYNIFDNNGNITYKHLNSDSNAVEIYHGNASIFTYGADGLTANATANGIITLSNANATAETGTLTYTRLDNNNYLYATDISGARSADRILVEYKLDKSQLDEDIVWEIVDNYQYNDGYTDPRKVKVAPIDSDNDLVPDRPLQFNEFAEETDFVIYEYYKDFDGYSYDRPVSGVFVDYRNETSITQDGTNLSPGSFTNNTPWSTINYILVDTLAIANTLENINGYYKNIKVYIKELDKVYKLTASSTDANNVTLVDASDDFLVKKGRGATQNTALVEQQPCMIKWSHTAPNDVRIDPSISNIVEMLVLTNSYYDDILKYINVPGTQYPLSPTNYELENEFEKLDDYKGASDSIVFRSAKFKRIFGTDAEISCQAKFRVVKLDGSTLSDNDLKSQIISAFNEYFNVDNWEFGETFYFTELSSFVHQRLGSNIGSIVIIPKNTSGKFGDLFQIKAQPDELFINTAKVSDIEIVSKISSQTLRVDR